MGKVRPDDLTSFRDIKLLSFDVYSTLIDEQGRFGKYRERMWIALCLTAHATQALKTIL